MEVLPGRCCGRMSLEEIEGLQEWMRLLTGEAITHGNGGLHGWSTGCYISMLCR